MRILKCNSTFIKVCLRSHSFMILKIFEKLNSKIKTQESKRFKMQICKSIAAKFSFHKYDHV
jgi:hypothetical protein